VRPNEIGSVDLIRRYAEQYDCKIFGYELEIQFRCGGCEGFINWVTIVIYHRFNSYEPNPI